MSADRVRVRIVFVANLAQGFFEQIADDQSLTNVEIAKRINVDAARLALFTYFNDMTEDRRKNPRDDQVSILANSKVDGEPLPPRAPRSKIARP
mgnify:CR=1 FL=1